MKLVLSFIAVLACTFVSFLLSVLVALNIPVEKTTQSAIFFVTFSFIMWALAYLGGLFNFTQRGD